MTEPTPRHAAVEPPKPQDHMLSNKVYDGLKFLAMILLPALASLYFALAPIWNLPNAESVVGTITVVDTFLGGLLKVSNKSYDASESKYDGDIHVEATPEGKKLTLALNGDPDTLDSQKQIVFKVVKK
jgi:putative holin Dp-1